MEKRISTSWKAFTQIALPILEDGVRTGLWRIRYSARQRYKFHEDGGFESEVIAEPDVGGLVHDSEDEIKLQDNLKIRRTTEEELEQLMNMHSLYGPFPFFKVPRLKFSIELRVESPKVFVESVPKLPADPVETLDRLVTALRIFKSGNVTIDIVRTTPEIKVPGLHESATHRESYLPTGHPYLLKKDEEVSLRSFWSDFRTIDP